VKRDRVVRTDVGDPRKQEGAANPQRPDPAEGLRLVKAFLAIKDAEVRRALIDFAEALARQKS